MKNQTLDDERLQKVANELLTMTIIFLHYKNDTYKFPAYLNKKWEQQYKWFTKLLLLNF